MDNLKLGYGGTKKEMERLLKDAEELTGMEYDIENLSDVYEAIHAIQQNLEITGTTAEEASETLSGSFNAMKSAFRNVLGGLMLGEDIKPQLRALGETVSTFLFNNLLPAMGNILSGLPDLIGGFMSMIPGLFEGLANYVTSIDWVATAQAVWTSLGNALGGAVSFIGDVGTGIRSWIEEKLGIEDGDSWSTIGQKVMGHIGTAIDGAKEHLGNIATTIKNAITERLGIESDTSWLEIARTIIYKITGALGNLGEEIGLFVRNLISGIVDWFSNASGDDFSGIANGIVEGIKLAIEGLGALVKMTTALVNGFLKGILGVESWSEIGQGIIDGITGWLEQQIINLAEFIKFEFKLGPEEQLIQDMEQELLNRTKDALNNNQSSIPLNQAFASAGMSDSYVGSRAGNSNPLSGLQQTINQKLSEIETALSGFKQSMSTIWQSNMEALEPITSSGMAKVNQEFRSGNEPIQTTLNGMKTALTRIMTSIMTSLSQTVTEKTGEITRQFNRLRTSIEQSVRNINLYSAGRSIMNGFLEGLESKWSSVTSFVSGIGPWIQRNKGPIEYDRKLLVPAGTAIMGGLYSGLADNFEQVKRFVSGIAGEIESSMGQVDLMQDEEITLNRVIDNDVSQFESALDNMRLSNQMLFEDSFQSRDDEMLDMLVRVVDRLDTINQKEFASYLDQKKVSKELDNPLRQYQEAKRMTTDRMRGVYI